MQATRGALHTITRATAHRRHGTARPACFIRALG
jgi:hypothetical protein